MDERYDSLAHGNGGRLTRELIEEIFARHLKNSHLDTSADAVPIDLAPGDTPMITTDGFIVQPLEFPGSDIGALAVNGTVNDLAVSGARPQFLTLNAFIEEGLEFDRLDRIIKNLARAARAAAVHVVAGDTKVVPRGHGGELYLATTGVGIKKRDLQLGTDRIKTGDVMLVSGPVGDHGISIMLARESFELKGDVRSDCAPVVALCEALHDLAGLRFMRDPTRGGLATVAHEIAQATGTRLRMFEKNIPIRPEVQSVCEILGFDPYYLACEGRVVAFIAPDEADTALEKWRELPGGELAARIGVVEVGKARVILETKLGGERILEELEDDPLPRIC